MSEDEQDRRVRTLMERAFKCGYSAGYRSGADDILALQAAPKKEKTKQEMLRAYEFNMARAWYSLWMRLRAGDTRLLDKGDHNEGPEVSN